MHGLHRVVILTAVLVVLTAYLLSIDISQVFFYNRNEQQSKHIVSHAYCYGTSHVDRRCTLKNVCLKVDSGSFIFFNDPESTYHGVPEERNNPAFVSLSSISYHNQYLFDYVDVHSSHYELLYKNYTIEWLDGYTYVYGRFKPDNLMHVLHDDLFPLFYSMQVPTGEKPEQDRKILFLDHWNELLAMAKDSDERVKEHHCSVCFDAYKKLLPIQVTINYLTYRQDKLLCMHHVDIGVSRDTLWYDYGFNSPQKPVHHDSIYLRETVDRILKRVELNRIECEERPILLIVRQNIRLILNLKRIQFLLTQYRLPYKMIEIDKYSHIIELIREVRCARFILGMHGSGLALASFLPTGSGVLELFPFAIDPNNYTPYRTLCERLSLHYESWVNVHEENTVTHPHRIPELGGLIHLPNDTQEKIQTTKSVPLHLCCSDAYWLYRINQDTIVHMESFQPVLMSMVEKTLSLLDANYVNKRVERFLTPGKVTSLKCTRNGINGIISWSEPWNLHFLHPPSNNTRETLVKYQVNIQSSEDENISSVSFTPDTEMTLTLFTARTFIWVRCIYGSVNGPYNNKPINC